MDLLWQIALLAVVQGICEFLPISSDGHLVVVQTLIGYSRAPLVTDIVLHAGTLLAVLIAFRADWWGLLRTWRDAASRRTIFLLAVASLPTALIGLLFRKPLGALFAYPAAAGVGFLLTALFLFASRRLRLTAPPPVVTALLIGVVQGLAIAPGVSRSGLTIALALILSQDRDFAFRFSFLLSIPAVAGALLLEGRHLTWGDGAGPGLLVGAALAAVTGLAALHVLRGVLRRGHFHRFAGYCLALGLIVLLFLR